MCLRSIWMPFSTFWMFLASAAIGQDIDKKQGDWGHLSKYIGTYNYEAVLSDDEVSTKLSLMLGHEFNRLEKNLSVHGPIGFSGHCLILDGNAPHYGFDENAYLNICLSGGSVDVVLTGAGAIQIFSEKSRFQHLDWTLRAWIKMHQSEDHFTSVPTRTTFIQTD